MLHRSAVGCGLLTIATLFVCLSGCGGDDQYYLKRKPRVSSDDARPAADAKPQATSDATAKASTTGAAPAADLGSVDWKNPTSKLPSELKLTDEQLRQRAIAQMTRLHTAIEGYATKNEYYLRPVYREPSTGKPGLSWRVFLLPELGHKDLFLKFSLAEAWDGPLNRKLIKEIPGVYQSPHRRDEKTNYQLLTGAGTFFVKPYEQIQADMALDGVANSLLLVEVSDARAAIWTKPDDYEFAPPSIATDLFALRKDGCLAIFGGATGVRQIPADIAPDKLAALTTASGGETIEVNQVTVAPSAKVDTALLARLERPAENSTAAATGDAPSPTPTASATPAEASRTEVSATSAPKPESKTATDPATELMTGPVDDSRLPVPSDEELATAGALMKKAFGDEYAVAKNSAEKKSLGQKLLRESSRVGLDLAANYVLLRAARDIANQAGDVTTALAAMEAMGKQFRIDPIPPAIEILEAHATANLPSTETQSLFDAAQRLCLQALERDDFQSAKQLLAIGNTLARRLGRRELIANVTAGQNYLLEAKRQHELVSSHLLTLVRTPADPTANAAVGRYLCLVKHDWTKGLARLRAGTDSRLKTLAQWESRVEDSAESQLEIADQWWAFGDSLSSPLERSSVRLHTRPFYEAAMKNLPPGLQRTVAERRLAEIRTIPAPRQPNQVAAARRVTEDE